MDIKQGDLGLLLALDALLDEESVSAAASRLGMSQPAMSAQLKRLRHLFNDPLLTPSGRRLVATSRALPLQHDLKRHLQDLDALVRENKTFDPSTTRKTFRVIGTDYVHAVLAATLEARLRSQAPNARLALLSFDPKTVWSALENDKTDIALVTGMMLADARAQSVIEEDFRVIQRRGLPRGTKKMTLGAFCSAPHILVSPEGGGADKVLAAMGRSRTVTVSLPSFLLAPALVAKSDALCLLPRRIADLHDGVVDAFEPPFESPTFNVDMLWHPRRQNDPAHIWFRDEVKALAKRI